MFFMPKCIGMALLISIPLLAQKAQRAEYEKQLSALQIKERSLREQIAQEQTAILELKAQIDASRERTTTIRQQKYALLGITENNLIEYIEKTKQLDVDLKRFLKKTDVEITSDTVLFLKYVQQAESLQKSSMSRLRSNKPILTEIVTNITSIEERYSSLKEKRALERVDTDTATVVSTLPTTMGSENTYTVTNGNGKPETLFRIAEKVYGDPYKWTVIYQANKSVIDRNFNRFQRSADQKTIVDPSDLIFPGQVLAIPR